MSNICGEGKEAGIGRGEIWVFSQQWLQPNVQGNAEP